MFINSYFFMSDNDVDSKDVMTIEGSNIEYGNIEKCNVNTNLTSKIWRLVTSKKNNGNIEFIIDLFNIDSKNRVKRGQTGS